ncbi:MAG: hypothetical protein ABIJ16_08895, partial [Bacteroidota bacterium]
VEFHQKHTSIALSDSLLNCIDLHRFGFNGQEKDDEITGVTGSHLDFGARIYDARIGRLLSIDPLCANAGHIDHPLPDCRLILYQTGTRQESRTSDEL